MSSNLYDQAIADAKKLKELAEKNATNKIIESIAPKIRMLIEQEIDDEIDLDIDGVDDEEYTESDDLDSDLESLDTMIGSAPPISSVAPSPIPVSDDSEIELDEESEDEKNVTVNITVESRLDRRAKLFRNKAIDLVIKLKEAKTKTQRNKILIELSKIKRSLVLQNEADKKLNNEINEVLKESKKMNKNKKSWINENSWWLFEAEEGDEDLDLDLGDEGGDEDEELDLEDEDAGADIDVDAIKSAVEELAGAIGLEVAGGEEGDEDEDLEEEEDEDLDLDLEEADYMDEMYHEADYMDEADEDEDEEVEINEAAIRRELARLKRRPSPVASRNRARIAESRRKGMSAYRRRRLAEMGDPMGALHGFADEVIEVSEQDLINALAEELGSSHGEELNIDGSGSAAKMAGHFGGGKASGEAMKEARRRQIMRKRAQARRIQESKNLQSQKKELMEAKRQAAAAKRELQESNLFNAKLLYVNKLMQQHDLNAKQQRAIVEALDNAKTQREAKLLYTSLTESLRRRAQSNKTSSSRLSEGLVRGGSASSPARSSAPAKSSTGLDRWATLAGIKK